MQASIIINTYNRAPFLKRLLAGLDHLKGAEFEVIVVNGPSTDDTASLLEQYRGRIKVVGCPTRNLSHSRNLGIAVAAGEIVIFIDDDALPIDSEWLARYVRAFNTRHGDGNLGLIGGPVLHGDEGWFEFNGGSTSEYGFQVFKKLFNSKFAPDGKPWYLGVPGGNCAIRRDVLLHCHGFDQFYKYYLDETDVCIRVARLGYKIKFLPENSVRHYSASSERRKNLYDRNWDVITRSDTYFALKNAGDPLFLRIINTLKFANQKHFVKEIDHYGNNNEISWVHWLRLRFQWFKGLLSGMWAGLFQERQMGNFDESPNPFLPFQSESAQKPLRIALLTQTIPTQPSYGGIGRYTYDLAWGLHERGHEVHIICRDNQPIRHLSLGFIVHGLSEEVDKSPTYMRGKEILNKNLAYALAVEKKLVDLYVQGVEFDVVHASNWDAEAIAVIREGLYPVSLMLVTPLAQVVQTEKWQSTEDLDACITMDRWQIEHADVVCIPSMGVLQSYQNLMKIEPDKLSNVHTTPLGIVPDTTSYVGNTHSKKERKKILFVGRLEWRKGIDTLLNVLKGLMQQFPDWECHLVGDDTIPIAAGGTFKQQFLEKHRGSLWLNRVIFHGVISETDLRYQYQTCSLFVAPSRFESFGLIFQEAMQYGKAVIGCLTGGIPEVVAHDVDGLLITPGVSDELEDALIKLMQDENLRERMGASGKRRIQERDNYKQMTLRLENVYYSLVANKGNEYVAFRKLFLPRCLPIFDNNITVQRDRTWEITQSDSGVFFLAGNPLASITFESRAGTAMDMIVFRHPQGGILELRVNEKVYKYFDLYSPNHDLGDGTRIRVYLPGNKNEAVKIKLFVHPEHNPESFGNEIWLKQVTAYSTY